MKRTFFSAASLVAILASGRANADSAVPVPDVAAQSDETENIVVTATRSPQPLYRIGSSITVITKNAIDSSQTLVMSDLLTQTPGVSYSRTGGVGETTSLRIRGAETEQTVVVIDGVKLNDPASAGGGYNFANLMTGDIQRIEILRGAQSTLWGSQAIGGVVNIVTAEPTKPFEGSAEAEGGSRGTGYGAIGVGGADGRLTWRLAGNYYTTDGISMYARGTENDGYQNAGVSGRARYEIADDVSVDLRGVYSHAHSQFDGLPAPSFTLADTPDYSITDEYLGYAGLNFGLFNGRFKNRIAYTYTDTDRDNFNPIQPVTPRTFDSTGHNRRWEYQGSFSVLEGWDTIVGAEHEQSSFRTVSPTSSTPNPAPTVGSVGITSGYAQLQAQVIPDLTLTGGIRVDSHDTFGLHALGQAAAAWSLNDGRTILRASFGQGFKAPTLYQLYTVYGNTALRPEQADSWDGGVEQHFFNNAVTVSVTGFYRKTLNQIDFVSCPSANVLCTAGKPGVYDNIARTQAAGIELAGTAKVDALLLQANYTYTDTENTAPGNINYGKELARRPKNAANFVATYLWPYHISTGVSVRYVGDTFDTASNTFVLPAYTLVDIRASWMATDMVEVYGRVENLFDKTYATARNYGAPGRGAFAGVRVRY